MLESSKAGRSIRGPLRETIHVQDASGHEFATRLGNVFIIGKGTKPWVSLPKGIKLTIIEEARKRHGAEAVSSTA